MMALPICSQCGRAVQPADAAFCPYCGSVMTAQTQNVPEGAKAYLRKADDLKDPVKKHELLLKAEREYPDCLEVAEALLFLGRLYERNPRELDYSVIKCFLWHMYLTPGEFPEEKKQQMREELFRHPQLVRCMQLAPDANAFLRRYLKRLGCEFVALFLKGSNHYTRTWFGFRIDNRMSRVLAQPVAQMIVNIRADEQLTPQERAMLCEAIYAAFLTETGGEPRWVDEELEKLGHPVPTHS